LANVDLGPLERRLVEVLSHISFSKAFPLARKILWNADPEINQIFERLPKSHQIHEFSLPALQEYLTDSSVDQFGIPKKYLIREAIVPVPKSNLVPTRSIAFPGIDASEANRRNAELETDEYKELIKLENFDLLDLPGAMQKGEIIEGENSLENAFTSARSTLAFELGKQEFSFDNYCIIWNLDELQKREDPSFFEGENSLSETTRESFDLDTSQQSILARTRKSITQPRDQEISDFFVLVNCAQLLNRCIDTLNTGALLDQLNRHIKHFEIEDCKRLIFAPLEPLPQINSKDLRPKALRFRSLKLDSELDLIERQSQELAQMVYSSINPGVRSRFYTYLVSQFDCDFKKTCRIAQESRLRASKLRRHHRPHRTIRVDNTAKLLRAWIKGLQTRFRIDANSQIPLYQLEANTAEAIKNLIRVPPEWLPPLSIDASADVPIDHQITNYISDLVDAVVDQKTNELNDFEALGIPMRDHKKFLHAWLARSLKTANARDEIARFIKQTFRQDALSMDSVRNLLAVKIERVITSDPKRKHRSEYLGEKYRKNSPERIHVINPFARTLKETASE